MFVYGAFHCELVCAFFSSLSVAASPGNVTSVGGAISVNITGVLANEGLPFFSSNLIQDSRESLDDVPEKIVFKVQIRS